MSKYSFIIFNKRIFQSLIICSLFIVTTFLIVLSNSYIIKVNAETNFLNKPNNYIFYSPLSGAFNKSERPHFEEEKLTSKFIMVSRDLKSPVTLIGYNDDFFDYYKPYLKKGKWEESDEYIPCAIYNTYTDYKIGDIYNINLEGKDYKFKVIGLMDKLSMICTLTSSGDSLSSENLVQTMENFTNLNNYPVLVFDASLIEGHDDNYCYNEIIILKEDTSESRFNEIKEILNTKGFVNTKEDITLNDKIALTYIKKMYYPFIALLSVISVVGLIGILFLMTYENMHFFTIIYLNGGKKRDIFIIMLGYISLILIFSLTILTGFLIYSYNNDIFDFYIFSNYIYIIILFSVLVLGSTWLFLYFMLKDKSKLMIVRKE